MKKVIALIMAGILIISISACETNNNTDETFATGTENSYYEEENGTSAHIHTGIVFPRHSASTEYNGYTYELVGGEKDENGKVKRSMVYRYKDDGAKEEWYDLRDYNVPGIFIDGELFYIKAKDDYDRTGYLKKLNLETLMVEKLFTDYYVEGMFKYDNDIFLPCCSKIVSYNLSSGNVKTIVDSEDLDDYYRMYDSNVFACNDKLWIIAVGNKVYKADLDGSNLAYAGFSIPSFFEISSVHEDSSELIYYADIEHYFYKKSISLETGEISDIDSVGNKTMVNAYGRTTTDGYMNFDSSGVKVVQQ